MKIKPIQAGALRGSAGHNRGFTLVELLIVITIIAVLAALVVAMTQKIRLKAYQATALSSIRQVAAFNVAYSTENNGDINTMRFGGDPKEGTPWVSATYWGRLQPYIFPDAASTNQSQLGKNINLCMDQLLNSPDADSMLNTVISGARIYHDTSGLPVPFSFNAYLAPWGKFAKVSSIDDPSQTLYLTYGFGLFNETAGKAYVPIPKDKTSKPIYYLQDRHAIVACLDGHVEMVAAPIPERRFK